MNEHPVRCWLLPGHERCAVRAAVDLAENRVAWLRGNLDTPTPEAVDAALALLGDGRKPRQWRPGSRTLTPEQLREVRDSYGAGPTMQQLADRFGVSRQLIFRIVHSAEAA